MTLLNFRCVGTAAVLVLAAGCVGRPDGAYEPLADGVDPSTSFVADGGLGADAGPRSGLPPSRGIVGTDGAEDLPPEQRALLPLTGRYVLRADMYSVVSLNQLFARLEVDNTATHYSVAEVSLDPASGTLHMTERLCYQRFEHTCVSGCTAWSTELDARVTPFFPYTERKLEVEGDSFRSATAFEALGYDGSPYELPARDSDARVWNVSGDDNVREGVMTRIVAEGTPVGTVDCVVYTVQSFASAFEGSLVGGGLDGAQGALDTTGTDGRRLGASGPNAATCQNDSAGAAAGRTPNTIRFARVPMERFSDDVFWSCPALAELQQIVQ